MDNGLGQREIRITGGRITRLILIERGAQVAQEARAILTVCLSRGREKERERERGGRPPTLAGTRVPVANARDDKCKTLTKTFGEVQRPRKTKFSGNPR